MNVIFPPFIIVILGLLVASEITVNVCFMMIVQSLTFKFPVSVTFSFPSESSGKTVQPRAASGLAATSLQSMLEPFSEIGTGSNFKPMWSPVEKILGTMHR